MAAPLQNDQCPEPQALQSKQWGRHTRYHGNQELDKKKNQGWTVLCRLATGAVAGVALTIPQVYVLLRPSSSRFCNQPLLYNLICSIGFTLFMTAFALILVLLNPLPRWFRLLLYTFGAASFVEGISTVLMTALAGECAVTTPALYNLSVSLSALSILSTGYFLLLAPFWLLHLMFPGTVLNKESRTGICYEAVTCCPCLWHV